MITYVQSVNHCTVNLRLQLSINMFCCIRLLGRARGSWVSGHGCNGSHESCLNDLRSVFTARRLAKRGICRRRVSVCLSVCLSVCVSVSVTLRYCIKTAKRRITQITALDSPLTLVFWHQSSLRNSNGITPYGGDKCRWSVLKFVTFDENRAITRKRYKIDAYFLLKSNRKSYALYQMVMFPMTLGDP